MGSGPDSGLLRSKNDSMAFAGIYLVANGRVRPPAVADGLDKLDDGMLGGCVGHICRPFVVVGMHPKRIVPLACVSERTIQVGLS